MSTKKNKSKVKPWASIGTDQRYVPIYDDMRFSEAWRSLTSRQRDLYGCMRSALLRMTKTEQLKADQTEGQFFFNRMRWKKYPKGEEPKSMPEKYNYGLYSDEKSFYADRNVLVDLGFIEVVETYAKGSREKNLYRFSEKWKWYKRPPPEERQ